MKTHFQSSTMLQFIPQNPSLACMLQNLGDIQLENTVKAIVKRKLCVQRVALVSQSALSEHVSGRVLSEAVSSPKSACC